MCMLYLCVCNREKEKNRWTSNYITLSTTRDDVYHNANVNKPEFRRMKSSIQIYFSMYSMLYVAVGLLCLFSQHPYTLCSAAFSSYITFPVYPLFVCLCIFSLLHITFSGSRPYEYKNERLCPFISLFVSMSKYVQRPWKDRNFVYINYNACNCIRSHNFIFEDAWNFCNPGFCWMWIGWRARILAYTYQTDAFAYIWYYFVNVHSVANILLFEKAILTAYEVASCRYAKHLAYF